MSALQAATEPCGTTVQLFNLKPTLILFAFACCLQHTNLRTSSPSDMANSHKSTVFRVTGLPLDKPELEVRSTLAETIRHLLTDDEQQREVVIACTPTCDGSQSLSALVEFKGGDPKFLSQLEHDPLGDWQVEMGDDDINFDRHFFGFTQLYPTTLSHPVTAEYDTIPLSTDVNFSEVWACTSGSGRAEPIKPALARW